jgi:hypothetical protein
MDRARVNSLTGLLAVLILPLATAGCANVFDRQYEAAEALRQQAAARGYEWIGTASLLEQARDEAEQGNTEAALEFVAKARFQSEAALRQADFEAEAWRDRVLK